MPKFTLARFFVLAALVMASNVVGYAVSASLFMSQEGAEAIPVFYLVLGLLSMPVSIGFSKVIDRVERTQLFRYLLLGALIWVGLLYSVMNLENLPTYYSIYISTSLIDLQINVLFWTLVSDYFTTLELERHTSFLAMGMTSGGLVGGVLVRLLTEHMPTQNLLLGLPMLYGVMIAVLGLIRRSDTAIATYHTKDPDLQWVSSLRTFPKLLSRYPIIVLLATSTALSVQLWGMSELQFFTIYSQEFAEQEDLTGFLGLLSAVFGAMELAVTYFVTRPLIREWGISRMNLVYPFTTLISFLGLTFNFRLPTAIVVNLNYETLYSSIAQPVQNLNYTAIPHRFAGRVRVIIDGLLYPTCQAATGGLLLAQQTFFSPFEMAVSGVILSFAFLFVGYLTSKTYLRSMLARLRSGSLDLDDIRDNLVQVPDSYTTEVSELLTSDDPSAQILGLELAARLKNPSQFLAEIQTLLLQANAEVQEAVVRFLATGNHPDFYRYLQVQLVSESEAVRETVLETLIAMHRSLSTIQLCFFLDDPSPGVQALACVAAWQHSPMEPLVQQSYEQAWQTFRTGSEMIARRAHQTMIRAIRRIGDRQLIPLLKEVLVGASAVVKQAGLETLATLATPDDHELEILAINELEHDDPQVRAAAINLLRVLQAEDALVLLVTSLEDPSLIVRQSVITAIATYGDVALSLVQGYLSDARQEVVEAAIAAIGQIRTRRAEDLLLQHLQPDYRRLARTLRWQEQIPSTASHWQPLAIALQDAHDRLLRRVLLVLSALGHAQLLQGMHQRLYSTDQRQRLNAVETLASLEQRRFVQPMLPLLESIAREPWQAELSKAAPTEGGLTPNQATLLLEILECDDRWIRIGAIMTLAAEHYPIPVKAITDDDFLVKTVAQTAAQFSPFQTNPEELLLSRLFFLKQVSILHNLPLDDLLQIDRTLKEQDFLKGEVIFKEGSYGEDFYLIYRGEVQILKQVKPRRAPGGSNRDYRLLSASQRQLARLQPGEFFGDMEFFDQLPRSSTAVAVTDCTLLALSKSDFYNLITQRPEVPLQMCRVLSLRVRDANRQLED
ncbi:HEAT repeat domain-containing protein [Pantanalinema sp. GBBB05]|uniref:HEAT repeat domain-containing protein n=1 Tax=Pantanalinema sp. GBBB05 TaxID=2604139 RepID=UPI001E139216|nr:cyclic nucleotide-binding domain-containing protein [Pantanalinema sp. GBBB05]